MTATRVIAAACAALAIALALPSLADASLWLDETFSLYDAARPTADIFAMRGEAYGGAHHPPGYFLLLKATMAVCGTSEPCVRGPSVLANAGVAALLVVLGARLFGLVAGSVAGCFWAVMPYAIKYAQQARHYTLLALLAALALWALVVVLDRRTTDPPASDRSLVVLGAACGGALWVHLFALPFLGCLLLVAIAWILVGRGRIAVPGRRAWAIAIGTALVVALPLLPGLWKVWVTGGGGQLESAAGPVENAKALAIDVATFGLDVVWIPVLGACALLVADWRRRVVAIGLGVLAGLPLVTVFVRNPEHFVALRYFMPSLVAVALLVGAGAHAIGARVRALVVRVVPRAPAWCGVVAGVAVAGGLAVPIVQPARAALVKQWATAGFEPWRDVSAAIAASAGQGDLVVAVPWELVQYPLWVYPPGPPVVGPDALDDALASAPPVVFIVASHVERPERQAERRRTLRRVAAAGYARIELDGVPRQRAIEVLAYRRRG